MNVYEWIFHIYLCIILLFFFCNLTLYHETHTLSFHTFRKYDIMALDALFMQSTVVYLGSPFIGRLSYFGLWTVINSVVISDVVHKSLCGFVILCSGMTQLKDMDVETLDKLPHCPLDGTCWCKAQIWLCGTLWLGPWINAGEVPAGTQALRDPLIRLRGTVCLDPGPCQLPPPGPSLSASLHRACHVARIPPTWNCPFWTFVPSEWLFSAQLWFVSTFLMTLIPLYSKLIGVSLRARTKPCPSFCSSLLFMLPGWEQRVRNSWVQVNLQSQCYICWQVSSAASQVSFPEVFMRSFITAPEHSQHLLRPYYVP